ncbi:MAG TPA: TetR/AcrR family transcriptional regulator [Anaerolineae bacterium]|nr:TetR/AcrR family transcriptional regulator [Anaerolineae bacterium]
MSPKPDVSEERTEQIIEAALKVFAEHGVEKARMEDIGAEAGLSKATLYLYFKTKDVLIGVIMRRLFASMLHGFRVPDTGEGAVKEQLRQFAARLVAELRRMQPLLPLLYEFYAMGLRKSAAREVLGEFVAEFIAILAPVIGQGVASGELRAVDAEKVAIALGAMLEGTLLLWAFAPERVDLEAQMLYGTELLLSAL